MFGLGQPAQLGAEPQEELLLSSAEASCAWAQARFSCEASDDEERTLWLERLVAQGEPEAMLMLVGPVRDSGMDKREESLLRQAAQLGHPDAQFLLAELWCEKNSWERFVWLRRAAAVSGSYTLSLKVMVTAAPEFVTAFDSGSDSSKTSRILYEIGDALWKVPDWRMV